jgi:hypothetical protein
MPMFDFLTDAQYIALGRVVANAAELESLLATILTNLLELNEKQARTHSCDDGAEDRAS